MISGSLQFCAARVIPEKANIPVALLHNYNLGTIMGDSIMKQIKLTQGYVALVDDEDFEWLNQWKWCIQKNERNNYAMRGKYAKGGGGLERETIKMHRVILNAQKGQEIDHINHNGLDNRKQNIRICTHQQNMQNQSCNKNTSSKYKGVTFDKKAGRWRAQIRHNNITTRLGVFKIEQVAAKAYDAKAKELFGEFAYLNFSEKTMDD